MLAQNVLTNAKNTTMKCAKNALKNVESVKLNAEKWQLNIIE
jgi:hypothetical protein